EKILDDVIDRVLRTEKEGKLPPPPDKEGAKGNEGGHLADSIPPEDRARMGQFMQELHDRRTARGLPDDGKSRFPGAHQAVKARPPEQPGSRGGGNLAAGALAD